MNRDDKAIKSLNAIIFCFLQLFKWICSVLGIQSLHAQEGFWNFMYPFWLYSDTSFCGLCHVTIWPVRIGICHWQFWFTLPYQNPNFGTRPPLRGGYRTPESPLRGVFWQNVALCGFFFGSARLILCGLPYRPLPHQEKVIRAIDHRLVT